MTHCYIKLSFLVNSKGFLVKGEYCSVCVEIYVFCLHSACPNILQGWKEGKQPDKRNKQS